MSFNFAINCSHGNAYFLFTTHSACICHHIGKGGLWILHNFYLYKRQAYYSYSLLFYFRLFNYSYSLLPYYYKFWTQWSACYYSISPYTTDIHTEMDDHTDWLNLNVHVVSCSWVSSSFSFTCACNKLLCTLNGSALVLIGHGMHGPESSYLWWLLTIYA